MSSTLSRVPLDKRRQLAATLGLFAALFVAVGTVAAAGGRGSVLTAFAVVVLLVAVLLGFMAWGVAHSVRQAVAERELDAAVEAAVAASPDRVTLTGCDCGHDHDPTELHVPDDPCARDGHGVGCTHTCETCVFATLRSAPVLAEARPRPRPRPGPG